MLSTKVLIIIGVQTNHRDQAARIFRHLSSRGNDISVFDLSLMPWDWHLDIEETIREMNLLRVIELMESSDATLLVTDAYTRTSALTSAVHRLYQMTTPARKPSRSNANFVWEKNGVSTVILGGTVKKSTVAQSLWEVFAGNQGLDLSDIFPYATPRLYNLDYTKETAQAAVL